MLKRLPLPAYLLLCAAMLAMLLAAAILAINVGAVSIRVDWIFKIIANQFAGHEIFPPEWQASAVSIVWELRLPKVLSAVCIGASLAIAGILMQALTRNAMAEPFVLGISSGASTGAVAALLMGGLPLIGSFSVQAGAFGGALLSSVLVFAFAGAGSAGTTRLVLTGMALMAIFQALTNLLIFLAPDERKVYSAFFWMTGSLAGIYWKDVPVIAVTFILGFAAALAPHRSLDALLMGEERAVTLGVDTRTLKRVLIVVSSLLIGIMVSMSGVIGFVGLVVPHVVRTLFGAVHRRLMPIAALMGGIFLLFADMLARVLARPEEMPIGIITALSGAPFFLLLLRKSKYRFGE